LADPGCTIETHTSSDGYTWRWRRYPPTGQPRANVVIIHGIQSHGGWYEYSCMRLAKAGFAVACLDRRGSGLNEAARGDTPGFRRLLDDIAEFMRPLKAQSPSLPIFLVGISWGGKLALALQRRHPALTDGVALLCPGIVALVRPPLKQRLKIIWSRIVSPRRLFPTPLNDPELFTTNPVRQQFIRDDPLSLHKATARFLIESLRLDGYLRLNRKAIRLPVLLMLAGQDRIVNNDRVRHYVERLPSTDKEVIEYPEAHHTLEFEPSPDRFIDDLIRWMERHLPT
jgi:alpha-beta hydrolase superfamily lysophospholipase